MSCEIKNKNPLLAEFVVFREDVALGCFDKKNKFQFYGREHLRDFQPMKVLYCVLGQNGKRGLFVSYKDIAFFTVFEDEIESFSPAAI